MQGLRCVKKEAARHGFMAPGETTPGTGQTDVLRCQLLGLPDGRLYRLHLLEICRGSLSRRKGMAFVIHLARCQLDIALPGNFDSR